MFFSVKVINENVERNFIENPLEKSNIVYSTGIILLTIAIPCRLITDFYAIATTASSGNYNTIASQTGLADDFANLLIPAVLCIMVSRPRLTNKIMLVVAAYYVMIMSMTGDRRYYTAGLLALGAFYLSSRKKKGKIKPFSMVSLIIIAVLLLNFLEILQQARLGNLGGVGSFFSEYSADLFVFDDLLYDVLSEFGISFYSIVAMTDYIPKMMNYQFGLTFLRMIPSVLPIGFLLGDMFELASPSNIVNNFTGLPLGATAFGDLYANFGLFAIPASFFMGVIINLIGNQSNKVNSQMFTVIYYTSYYIMINLIRCAIFEFYRSIIWTTCIPLLVYMFYSKRKNS